MYILNFRSTALHHPTDYAMEKEHSSLRLTNLMSCNYLKSLINVF